MHDLTGFQRDCLRAIAMLGQPHGLAIKEWLDHEAEYSDVNHGRLYPNLDKLTERGFVEKGRRDDRTNEYHLTRRGQREVMRWSNQWDEAAAAVDTSWRPQRSTDGGESYPEGWAAPDEAARDLDPSDEHGTGVRRDHLMDARIDAQHAVVHLRRMYADLDGIADDLGLFPDEVNAELREVQDRCRQLKVWVQHYADALSELEAEAREAEQEASR